MNTPPRFEARDLADALAPANPVRLGDRVVYELRRIDATERRAFTALYAVPIGGGPARRLTQGAWNDRAPRADPRDRYVVFVSDRGAGEQVYRLDADGGEARALTAFPRGAIHHVAVSPDGARLAVVFGPANPDDDALPLAADLARRGRTDDLPETFPGASEVAPVKPQEKRPTPRARVFTRLHVREDGMGYVPTAPADAWIVDARTGDARRLTRGPHDHAMPCWTPDGRGLLVVTRLAPDPDLDPTRNDLVRIDVESGAVTVVAKPDGEVFAPSVAPSGDAVAYLRVPPDDPFGARNCGAWLTPLDGGEPRPLTAHLDRPTLDLVLDDVAGGFHALHPPLWSDDGERVVLVASDRGAVRLYEQPVAPDAAGRWLTDDARAVSVPEPLGGGAFAVVHATRGAFAEVAAVDADGQVRVLTAHNAALTARVAPRVPEVVTLARDGVTVTGYYLAPRDLAPGARAPAVLYIHGGPHVCYGERLFFEMQWLADEGFAVLYANPRGSHSYGEAYSMAIEGQWGTPDDGDQLAFADWLAARPEVDPARLGVAGGSYGAYMTLHLCGTSDRFRAAVAERGLYDWASNFGGSDYGHLAPRVFGATPWQDPARYLAASSIRHVDRVNTPMLVMHGEGDQRVGTEQAVALYSALKLRGVPTALVLYPEEGHGMSRGGRIDRRLERLRQIRAWLGAWLN